MENAMQAEEVSEAEEKNGASRLLQATKASEEAAPPFESLAFLRQEHSALLRRYNEAAARHKAALKGGGAAICAPLAPMPLDAELRDAMKLLARRGAATGKLLSDDAARWDAQGLLNYWTAVLYRHGEDAPDAALEFFEPVAAERTWAALPNPYLGPRAFRYGDHPYFFGREALVQKLTQRVATEPKRLLVVMGMSGSGKSSLILAGVVPALRGETIRDASPDESASPVIAPQDWRFFAPFVPGSDPLLALAFSLMGGAETAPATSAFSPAAGEAAWAALTEAAKSEKTAGELADRLLASPAEIVTLLRGKEQPAAVFPALFVIDQFEEAFTQCADEKRREAFINALLALVTDGETPHRVLLTMRYEFRQEASQVFQKLWEQRSVYELSALLEAPDLRAMIERPAWRVGVKCEDGIVEDLVARILGQPAALPLLQFTLLELWKRRRGNVIDWQAYREVGEPLQALERAANKLYEETLPQNRRWIDALLLRMLTVDIGEEPMSRRVSRAELATLPAAPEVIDALLDQLTAAHLLRRSAGATPDEDRYEIAHEALPRNWKHLSELVAQKRQETADRQRFRAAIALWEKHNYDPNLLIAGSALTEAEKYENLDEREGAYLQKSREYILRRVRADRVKIVGMVAIPLLVIILVMVRHNSVMTVEKDKLTFALAEAERKNNEADKKITKADKKIAEADTKDNEAQHTKNIADIKSSELLSRSKEFLLQTAGAIKENAVDPMTDGKVNKPEYIVWHTAYSDNDISAAQIRAFAKQTLHFKDIQYHFVIRCNGKVEKGRPLSQPGAHVLGLNNRSIGLCFSGDATRIPLTDAQMQQGMELCRELMQKYKIPAEKVIGHYEVNKIPGIPKRNTRCPGKLVNMDEVRKALSPRPGTARREPLPK